MLEKDFIFVLGAQDPEMREIERVLRKADRPCVHAAAAAMRCTPRTAYEADSVGHLSRSGRLSPEMLPPTAPVVFVETGLTGRQPALRVDHHNPGDPGYDKDAAAYMQGSSLGQVLALLEMEASTTQRLLAAADHCLTAAYQGQCPGVDPYELLFLRASWQVKMTGRTLGDMVDGILDAAKRVRQHFDSELDEAVFLDPTDVPGDLPEGAAYAGKAVRYRQLLPDGQLKEMLKGAGPEHIERFMDQHRSAARQVYGNPYRGYAGAYY